MRQETNDGSGGYDFSKPWRGLAGGAKRPVRVETPSDAPRDCGGAAPRAAAGAKAGGGGAAKPAVNAGSSKKRSAKSGKIVTIGSLMADTIAVAAPGLVERVEFKQADMTAMLIEEGRKYTAESIKVHLGGGGANSAVCASRLGWSAATLAAVGEDVNGAMLLEKLGAEGVDVSAIRRNPDVGTGVSLIVTSDQANASILVFRGASETLKLADIGDPVFEGANLVHIGPLSSGSAECFPALVEQGAWSGAMVSVNPGIRQLRNLGEAFLGAVANVNLVSINAREFSVLTLAMFARGAVEVSEPLAADVAEGGEAPEQLLGETFGEGAQKAAFRDALAALHRLGPRFISVTDGAFGSYLSVSEAGQAPRLFFQEPAPIELVRGTAGAGDCYGSTLACSLAQGMEPPEAMLGAALNAASVVGEINTTDGLMSVAQLKSALAKTETSPAREV